MNANRRLAVLVLILAIVAVMGLGCSSDGVTTSQDSDAGTTASPQDMSAEVDALEAQAEAKYGSEPWWPHVTGWRYTTALGAPTLAIVMDIDTTTAEDQELVFAVADAIAALEPDLVHNIDIYSTYQGLSNPEHTRVDWATVGGTPMAEAYDLPEAPTGDLQMDVWMEGVFSPGGIVELGPDETWYESIEGYSWEAPGGSGEDILLVHTSMTHEDMNGADLQFQTLARAVNSSGSPLLREWQILGPGGEWLFTIYGQGGEPGQDGPNYPD